MKFLNIMGRENILKSIKEKNKFIHKRSEIRALILTMETRRQWRNVLRILKESQTLKLEFNMYPKY